ncbi:uncharacterized protein STEHIDRAFT_170815 [Stereum hirsutum FP-91666 SS1]|uniref:uncharacterized protein n=1 Tax=Stereum hirsutum (strain FP-91666) TaxID=721885 RepID=UPI0004449BE2|nr:uncharacterized protein STEHIDRAFT_170815 [Stereum hirsutum FP-91666 SS1]EIM83567.1 hypothetical protein STEHIDRAFT_170815 [Stereum hirsutum FP-91666 SS1]
MTVTAETHVRRGHPITFGLIILFSIIELAVSAWLVARYNQHHNYLSGSENNRVRFLLFNSIWTLLLAPIFMGVFFAAPTSFLGSLLSHSVFIFLTWVLWLAGAAAITATLGGRLDCGLNYTYCGQLNALEAFAWIQWVLLTFALVSVILLAIRARRAGNGVKGPMVQTTTV